MLNLLRSEKHKTISIIKSFLEKNIEIGIGLINFNSSKETINCYKSIINFITIPNLKIILENSSKKHERDQLFNYIKKTGTFLFFQKFEADDFFDTISLYKNRDNNFLILIQLKNNIGFCSGYNLIVQILNFLEIKYVLVLNNDTKIFKGSIEQLLETIKKRKATAISPLIYEKENKIWYAGGEYSWYGYKYLKEPKDYKDCYPTNVYSGCCVIFKTYEYLKMGGMEDSLFISIDEPEFSRRIKKQKGKILVEPRAKIFHEVGRSIGKRGSRYHDYFWVRNRYIYSSLHNNFFFHLSFLIIYTLLRVLKWGIYFFKKQGYRIETEFLGVKDYFKKNWGAGSLLKELSALDFKYLQKNYG